MTTVQQCVLVFCKLCHFCVLQLCKVCVYRVSHALCTSFADAVSYSGKVGFVSSEGRGIVLHMHVYVCALDVWRGRGGKQRK